MEGIKFTTIWLTFNLAILSEVFHHKTVLHYLIITCYYTYLLSSSLLRAKKVEVCEIEITFKAVTSSRVWNHAVLERLNFSSNFNNPYVVAIQKMCQEYTLPPHLPSRYLSGKVRKPQQCTIQPLEILVQRQCFFF